MSKAKKASEDQEIVHTFLQTQNRPFSVQNIVDSLQKSGIKKAAVERSLASLVEKKLVSKKEYGKAKVFIAAQDAIDISDAEEIKRLEDELKSRRGELQEASERVNQLRKETNILTNEYTMDESKEMLSKLSSKLEQKKRKRGLLGDESNLISKDDKTKLEYSYYQARSLWKKCRRIVSDITDAIGEASGKKRTELFEELSIESDEAANVSLKEFPEISNPAKRRGATVFVESKKAKT